MHNVLFAQRAEKNHNHHLKKKNSWSQLLVVEPSSIHIFIWRRRGMVDPPSSDFWSPLTWSFGWRSHLIEVANLVFWFWHILLIKIVYLVFYVFFWLIWQVFWDDESGNFITKYHQVLRTQTINSEADLAAVVEVLTSHLCSSCFDRRLLWWHRWQRWRMMSVGGWGPTRGQGRAGQGSLAEDSWIQAEGILWRQWAARPVGRDIAPGRRRCASTGSVAASRRLWRHFYVLPPTGHSYKMDSGKFCLNFSDSVIHHVSLLKPSLSKFCTNLVMP